MSAVDEYLSNVKPEFRDQLKKIRAIVMEEVPEAVESIAYDMPAYKYKGKPLIYYGAFKNHMSLFPTPGPAAVLQDKLKDYIVAKGTIQFTLEKPLPESLVREILQARVNIINQR